MDEENVGLRHEKVLRQGTHPQLIQKSSLLVLTDREHRHGELLVKFLRRNGITCELDSYPPRLVAIIGLTENVDWQQIQLLLEQWLQCGDLR